MSLKAHIVIGTLLGMLLGVGAVTVLSCANPSAPSSTQASERDGAQLQEDAVSPAALRSDVPADGFSRPMRPGAGRRSLQT